MLNNDSRLRVALLAGTLGQGGAEKQLIYAARALMELGATVRVYSLTRGEFYERALRKLGLEPVWAGKLSSPALRLASLARSLIGFRPDIIHSAHFFTNLYAAGAASMRKALVVGSIRCDVRHALNENGRWGKALLNAPASLVANSYAGKRNAEALGVPPRKIHVLANVIDLTAFRCATGGEDRIDSMSHAGPTVAAVGSLIRAKRFDRFLLALALARKQVPDLKGIVIGDGPEKEALEKMAAELELSGGGVRFLGRRNDVPALLRQSSFLALTSEHEGFPNVMLEAMAARLPVIATAVGDVERVVEHGVAGFIASTGDPEQIAARMVELASSRDLRLRMGEAGRGRLEREYSFEALPRRLLRTYRAIATQQNNHRALSRLV